MNQHLNIILSHTIGILFLSFLISCSGKKEEISSNRILRQKDYRFPSEIESLKELETTNLYYSSAPLYYSWIGEYQKTIDIKNQKKRPSVPLSDDIIKKLELFHSYNAVDYIIEKYKNEKLIIINEDHALPQNRLFTIALLKKLFDNGFKLLGFESLNHLDSLIQERGYPTDKSGFFTVDPQFGNLLRETTQLGYQFFTYDKGSNKSQAEREMNQVKNITAMIQKFPEEKMIIYCGPFHAYENGDFGKSTKPMAYLLKETTGINPLTINQTIVINNKVKKESNPFTILPQINQPSVFIKENGELFCDPIFGKFYDIEVVHPSPEYIDGRPTWLQYQNSKKWVNVPHKEINISYPILVLAFNQHESEDAIPVDIISLNDKNDSKNLCLKDGIYRIKILNQKGVTQTILIDTSKD